jgi:hypothetical protein
MLHDLSHRVGELEESLGDACCVFRTRDGVECGAVDKALPRGISRSVALGGLIQRALKLAASTASLKGRRSSHTARVTDSTHTSTTAMAALGHGAAPGEVRWNC